MSRYGIRSNGGVRGSNQRNKASAHHGRRETDHAEIHGGPTWQLRGIADDGPTISTE